MPKPLKGVGRAARLERAAAKNLRACLAYQFGGTEDLLARFHGARAGHHNHLFAADFHTVGQPHHGAFRTEGAPHQLVGRADAVDGLHAGQHFELARIEVNALADCGQHALTRAGGAMHGKAHLDQMVGDLLDLVFARRLPHRNNHGRW